jgi:hypothetical protein
MSNQVKNLTLQRYSTHCLPLKALRCSLILPVAPLLPSPCLFIPVAYLKIAMESMELRQQGGLTNFILEVTDVTLWATALSYRRSIR